VLLDLFNGLPALEKLHKAWSSHIKKDKFGDFKPALLARVVKIKDYYNKTALTDAYTMTMSMFYFANKNLVAIWQSLGISTECLAPVQQ
jgi:hypothetical protein